MKKSPITVAIRIALSLAVLACRPEQEQHSRVGQIEGGAEAPATIELSRLAAAESVYYRGEYDSARLLLRPLADDSRRRGDTATAARALTWLGLTAWRQGDYAAARETGERALDLKLRIGLKDELFRSYNALGLLAHNQGRYTEALSYFSRAETAAREVGDSAGIAKSFGNRGLSYVDIGEFDKARAGFDALRRMAEQSKDTRSEANALANLAMLDIRLGDPVPAISALERARLLYRQGKIRPVKRTCSDSWAPPSRSSVIPCEALRTSTVLSPLRRSTAWSNSRARIFRFSRASSAAQEIIPAPWNTCHGRGSSAKSLGRQVSLAT